jgi:hypothetical protein
VTGLRLNITGDLLDENNFPIPADQVRWMAEVTWDRASGFSGAYEVERATLPFNVFEPREYEFAGTVPTASTNAGTLRFSEPVDILRHAYCYRVTAVDPTVAGVRGPAAEVCTVRVPTTGPGAEITPGIPPTDFGPGPFPPDTGSGLIDPGDASGWTFTVIGMAAASAAAGALLAGRRRGARRS